MSEVEPFPGMSSALSMSQGVNKMDSNINGVKVRQTLYLYYFVLLFLYFGNV
jgi:hypothetical protein